MSLVRWFGSTMLWAEDLRECSSTEKKCKVWLWLWCCYHFGNWHPSCVSVCLVLLIVKLKHSREFDQTPISSESIYHLDPDIEAGAPRNISCADKELPRSNNGRANHLVSKFVKYEDAAKTDLHAHIRSIDRSQPQRKDRRAGSRCIQEQRKRMTYNMH